MDRFCMRGEELAVSAPARHSGRDGVMASPPPPRRRWLLEGAGAAFEHALTASTVRYDRTNLSTVPYAYEPGLIARLLEVVLARGREPERSRCKVIAYKVYEESCIIPTLINSHSTVQYHVASRHRIDRSSPGPCPNREAEGKHTEKSKTNNLYSTMSLANVSFLVIRNHQTS